METNVSKEWLERRFAAEESQYSEPAATDELIARRSAAACSPFVVINLRRLKLISCADRDAMQDAIRALRTNGAQYVALRWHAAAESYVQLEAHE